MKFSFAGALLICSISCSIAAAAEPNQIVLNIEPTPQAARNSEGSFVTLKSGRVFFVYTQFSGRGDEAPAKLVSIFSDDGGATWSDSPQVVVENEAKVNVMSVSLLRLRDGRIA